MFVYPAAALISARAASHCAGPGLCLVSIDGKKPGGVLSLKSERGKKVSNFFSLSL